jgi:VIT1/CCC1 family predicted Fe2+/Mn2+ transporter
LIRQGVHFEVCEMTMVGIIEAVVTYGLGLAFGAMA